MTYVATITLIVTCTITSASSQSGPQWTIDTHLDNRVFPDPNFTCEEESTISCIMRCMEAVAECFLATFNNDTGVCTCHTLSKSRTSPYTFSQNSVTAKRINITALPIERCDPYIFASEVDLCYEVKTVNKNFLDAAATCSVDGGRLVVIDNNTQQTFLLNKLAELSVSGLVWVGASDLDTEGTWKWFDGKIVQGDIWFPQEPKSPLGTEEDCGALFVGHVGMLDFECDKLIPFICEKVL